MDTFAPLASMGIPRLVVGVMPTRSLIVARPLQVSRDAAAGWRLRVPRSVDVRSALGEELTQDAAMAADLVRAIAAYRELGGVRQGGQQIERSCRIRSLHLGPELAGEALPASLVVRPQRLLEQRLARREHRKPDIVEVAPRMVRF